MPGLNQLKQFSEDIREIGDEVNIRAQRGEKPVSVPLPQGISEEDDSADFLIGLPEVEHDAPAAPEPEEAGELEADSADIDVSGLDSLLEPQVSADDDALADFLNDTANTPSSESTDTPSDMNALLSDFDSLSDFSDLENLDSSGGEINLNEDVPAAVLENDGIPPELHVEPEASTDATDMSDLSDMLDALDTPVTDESTGVSSDDFPFSVALHLFLQN